MEAILRGQLSGKRAVEVGSFGASYQGLYVSYTYANASYGVIFAVDVNGTAKLGFLFNDTFTSRDV